MIKKCSKCGVEQDISNFYFRKESGTYRTECKSCIKANRKTYYVKNKDIRQEYSAQYYKNNAEDLKSKQKDYYVLNREAKLEKDRIYNALHKKERQAYDKEYYLLNKQEILEYQKEYLKNKRSKNPSFRLRCNISRLINTMIKSNNGSKAGKSIKDFLNYSIDRLKEHLEKQFESWMNWENYGAYNAKTWNDNDSSTWTWQLDHIIPQSNLPYSSMEDDNFNKCWALENLRPLSAKQNLLDGVNRNRH
jgi:hypothetical protein